MSVPKINTSAYSDRKSSLGKPPRNMSRGSSDSRSSQLYGDFKLRVHKSQIIKE